MVKRLILFAAILALAVSTVYAAPFINPPEVSAPAWVTPFQYQRNFHWDCQLIDPSLYPTPATYQGTDDPVLLLSDTVYYTGDVMWYPGLGFGIDNTVGVEPLTGTAVFHIDNWDRDIPWIKHLWKEIIINKSPGAVVEETLLVDTNYLVKDQVLVIEDPLYPGGGPIGDEPAGILQDWWYFVKQNPVWEEVVITFIVMPGEFAYVSWLHIATECVMDCYKEGDPAFWSQAFDHTIPVEIYAGQTLCWDLLFVNAAVFLPPYPPDCGTGLDTFCITGVSGGGWEITGDVEDCFIMDWGYGDYYEFCVTAPCEVSICDYDTVYAIATYCYSCFHGVNCAPDCGDCNDPNVSGSSGPHWSVDTLILHVVQAPPALYIMQDSLYFVDQGQTAAYVPFAVCNGDPCAPPTTYGYNIVQKGHIPGPGTVGGTVDVLGGECENVYMILDAGLSIVCTYDTLTIIAWTTTPPVVYDTCVQIVHVKEPSEVPLFTAPVVTILVLAMILAAAVFMRRRAVSRA